MSAFAHTDVGIAIPVLVERAALDQIVLNIRSYVVRLDGSVWVNSNWLKRRWTYIISVSATTGRSSPEAKDRTCSDYSEVRIQRTVWSLLVIFLSNLATHQRSKWKSKGWFSVLPTKLFLENTKFSMNSDIDWFSALLRLHGVEFESIAMPFVTVGHSDRHTRGFRSCFG